jgi:ATP-binding cassette subfamily F protein uup
MAQLLSTLALTKSFSSKQLFSDLSFGIEDREKVGVIGPNGAGKSTLMQILSGLEPADSGVVSRRRDATIGYVPQEESFTSEDTVLSVLDIAAGGSLTEKEERDVACQIMIGRAGFPDPLQKAETLSGGWKKRLSIASALIREPNLLILDEPTNHLDLDGILWLEDLVKNAQFACLFVCHDRYFLEKAATRIIEISRQYSSGFLSVNGPYSQFLLERESYLEAQGRLESAMSTKMRREIEWLRHGAPARSTKAKYRIDEAGRMMQDLSSLKERNASISGAKIDFTASGRKTKDLLTAVGIAKSLSGRVLFQNLDLALTPGMRLGLLGPNGSGKTTLIKTLVGELDPDRGEIKLADKINIVKFDQDRSKIDLSVSVRAALCGEADMVHYQGSSMHISAWAKRFGFSAQQLDAPVRTLSGGERARLLIANLMLQSADLLILDEPGNDLDMPTLELLEESLMDFPGALLLVTHDRFMLESVATEVLALSGEGDAQFFASYSQWENYRSISSNPKSTPPVADKNQNPQPVAKLYRGLTRPERREFDRMEETVAAAEDELEKIKIAMTAPDAVSNYVKLQELMAQAEEKEKAIETLYARWQELESKMTG